MYFTYTIQEFDDEFDVHMVSQKHEERGYGLDLDLLTIVLILCFISYEKWYDGKK